MQKLRSVRSSTFLACLFTILPVYLHGAVSITPNTPFPVLSSYFDKSINEAGLLDHTFGTQGIVTRPVGRGITTAVQPNGTIIVAGWDTNNHNMLVAAYNPDGSSDVNFGTNGLNNVLFGYVYGLVLQPDGKIVVSGQDNPFARANFIVARYNADGSLDTSFNGTGSTANPAGGSNAVTLQPDGKIVATGYDTGGTNFCTARYNTDGTLDDSFNGTGFVVGQAGGGAAVGVQPDGKIVVMGGSGGNACVLRYNPDGSPDTTYGDAGAATGPASSVFAGVLQPDGKAVTVGDNAGFYRFVRFNSDGSLDNTFGTNGVVDIGAGSPRGATLQPDGKIIGVGFDGAQNFVVIRINPDGSADTSFGVNGVVTTVFAAGSYASGVALQPNGQIVVSGLDGAGNVGLVRYMNPFTVPSFTGWYGGAGFL